MDSSGRRWAPNYFNLENTKGVVLLMLKSFPPRGTWKSKIQYSHTVEYHIPVKRNEVAAWSNTKTYGFIDVKYIKHTVQCSLLVNACICMEKVLEDASNS